MVTEILNTCSICGRQFGRLWEENICPSCKLKKAVKEAEGIDLEEIRERITKRRIPEEAKRRLFIANLNREKFCEILDSLPSTFGFELRNICEDFDGYWQKTVQDGKTAWRKDDRVLLSQYLFPFKEEVCDALDREIGVYCKSKRDWQAIREKLFNYEAIQILRKRQGQAALILTKEKLKKLYFRENKSLEDIAKEYGTSRQNVLRIMKRYGLDRRTQSTARYLAMDEGKFPKLMQYEIKENFFSEWSPQMAWILGLLLTDGNVHGNNVTLGSVDIDLLEKVKKTLNLSKPIITSKQSYDKSKLINHIAFSSKRMREDLNKLGFIEKKSLVLSFPDVPQEYMRHFIRGYWDGDGSVYLTGGKIGANYVSGSLSFIKRLTEELYNIGIFKKSQPYHYEIGRNGTKIFRKVRGDMFEKYEKGKYPLTIQKEKRSKAYYIRLSSKENLQKLFHYFYDGVEESMYLTRKYNIFLRGLKLEKKGKTEQLTLDLEFG